MQGWSFTPGTLTQGGETISIPLDSWWALAILFSRLSPCVLIPAAFFSLLLSHWLQRIIPPHPTTLRANHGELLAHDTLIILYLSLAITSNKWTGPQTTLFVFLVDFLLFFSLQKPSLCVVLQFFMGFSRGMQWTQVWFSSQKFLDFATVALSFVCDKYCLIID